PAVVLIVADRIPDDAAAVAVVRPRSEDVDVSLRQLFDAGVLVGSGGVGLRAANRHLEQARLCVNQECSICISHGAGTFWRLMGPCCARCAGILSPARVPPHPSDSAALAGAGCKYFSQQKIVPAATHPQRVGKKRSPSAPLSPGTRARTERYLNMTPRGVKHAPITSQNAQK